MDDDDEDMFEIEWLECPKCGAKYITPQQVRSHQAAHSNYFEDKE